MLTIYRIHSSRERSVKLESVRRWIERQGIVHPVLVDTKDAYRERLLPGPVGYPALFLVGPDGVVVWEGASGRGGYEEAGAAALEAALPAPPGEPVPR